MYEQSIPVVAYIFIGITSLVVTYSQLVQKNNTQEEFKSIENSETPQDNSSSEETEIADRNDVIVNKEYIANEANPEPIENTQNENTSENATSMYQPNIGGKKKDKNKSKRKTKNKLKRAVKQNKRKTKRR